MVKKLIFILILLMIPLVGALDECQEIETANIGCLVVTPVITCSTYDSYTPAYAKDADGVSMSQIGSTGMYYFTFNESTAGAWTVLLCSNHTAQITIGTTDQANMNSINSTLYNEVNDLEENLLLINTSIMNNIDAVDINLLSINTSIMNNIGDTQTMLISVNGTLFNKVNAINSSIMGEMKAYSSNLTFIGDSVWEYSGDRNVTNLINPLDINETAIAQEIFSSNLTALGYTDNRSTGLFGDILIAMDTALYWIERLLN